jgi:NADH dehydrogenase
MTGLARAHLTTDAAVTARQRAESARAEPHRPRVVILGAGFGGLSAALALRRVPVDVTIIDRRNYHLFQPLLYQVATAGLSPADIASPIRSILSRQRNASVLMERVTGVDTAAREVVTESRRIPYDFLIVATGARHAYFGHDHWEVHAPGLKKIDDAIDIRRRILTAFEVAESCPAREPTEFDIRRGWGRTDRGGAGWGDRRTCKPRACPRFPAHRSEHGPGAAGRGRPQDLAEIPGNPLDKGRATACAPRGRGAEKLGGYDVPVSCVFWAAGVAASPAASWLGAEADRAGRVKVTPFLTLPDRPEVLVIGDTAAVDQPDGGQVPGVAPAAKQMGTYAARAIERALAGDAVTGPFRYRDFGTLATIGRKAAVADFGRVRLSGFPAWLLWSLAHIYFLIGFRNRAVVMLDWIWSYLTFGRGARLITGGIQDRTHFGYAGTDSTVTGHFSLPTDTIVKRAADSQALSTLKPGNILKPSAGRSSSG